MKSLNIARPVDDAGSDESDIKRQWKTAIKTLRTVRDAAFDHRAVHLRATLTQYITQNEAIDDIDNEEFEETKKKITRIRRLINTENMRKPFRSIHASMPSLHHGGLDNLYVPSGIKSHKVAAKFCDPDRSVDYLQLIQMATSDKYSVEYETTILDPAEIEEELLRYNRYWFRQAADTPFVGNGELFNLVGYLGLTEEADAIIEGDCVAHLGIPMSRETQVSLKNASDQCLCNQSNQGSV
jgi:hypothetical protein